MSSMTITAIPGIPDIHQGDDLAAIIGDALIASGNEPQDGDILCIAQKVFSKAEGCIIPLASVTPGPEAIRYGEELGKDPRKVEVVLSQSAEVVKAFRHPGKDSGTMICRHHLGFISANAAVDESNFEEEEAVMTLPDDPDRSVRGIQEALLARFHCHIGVVMTDTFGPPMADRAGQCRHRPFRRARNHPRTGQSRCMGPPAHRDRSGLCRRIGSRVWSCRQKGGQDPRRSFPGP